MLSKGSQTAVVMCKYLAFKGAPNSNCNLQVPCFQRGLQPLADWTDCFQSGPVPKGAPRYA